VREFTRPLSELRRSDAAEFGGKSANIGELLAAGVAVPHGFAVSAGAFSAFVEETGLDGLIAAETARAAGGDLDALADAAKAIGEAMRFAPLPEPVRDELVGCHEDLEREAGGERPPVAVRSSALGEDGEDASHAGQQESFLWICGIEQICDAVRDCWVSLYTPRAIGYRAALRGTRAVPAMGVTVQRMVDAEVSGVMFTCNPVSGDPSMVAVNASWGLGIAVVGGETTPDDYLVSKITGEIVRRTVSSKHVEYVPGAEGRGTVRVEVPPQRRDQPCLGDEQIAALIEVGRRIESHFGGHLDVEWALARGRSLPDSLLVLQARPVTRLPERRPKLSGSALSVVMSTFGAAAPSPEQP
jgi:phosphoenolpyruvate synthase/pyruvate phosphate dikinase